VTAYIIREGPDSCPVGCGENIVLVKCLPSGRLAGWCWACEVSLPVPLPDNYRLGDADIDPARYAPGGLELPGWPEVVAAGLSPQVIRSMPAAEWGGVGSMRAARQA
jgi:hypothetical protein